MYYFFDFDLDFDLPDVSDLAEPGLDFLLLLLDLESNPFCLISSRCSCIQIFRTSYASSIKCFDFTRSAIIELRGHD